MPPKKAPATIVFSDPFSQGVAKTQSAPVPDGMQEKKIPSQPSESEVTLFQASPTSGPTIDALSPSEITTQNHKLN